MSKATPGPWIEMSNDGYTFFIHAKNAKETDVPVARVLADQRDGISPEANARLIAQAPAMLEALKELHDAGGCGHEKPGVHGCFCDIIAKAEGETT